MGALWLAPDGSQKYVHLGSGSGSTMNCILADNFVDLLRLLAIGYDEICWDHQFGQAPRKRLGKDGLEFKHWVESSFHVTIPTTGESIVKNISTTENPNPADIFGKWVEEALNPP